MEVEIAGRIVEVINIQKNIKGTYLRILNPRQIVITSKKSFTNKEMLSFINNHIKWIEKKLGSMIYYDLEDDEIVLFGKMYQIIIDDSNEFKFLGNKIYLKNKNEINTVYDYGYKIIENKFYEILKTMDLNKKITLSFRKMKTRWGVCHYHKNKVVLNKTLIFVPMELVSYVIYHELVHFYYPNHSKDYYNKLSQVCPLHKEYRKQLRKYLINY
ncbi:MAG TPA: M48 family metallopeptidase [Acholeplasmataceae bacterium]|nr:M48 family metallopeptidase [Acholeplasmataceae bacterium]